MSAHAPKIPFLNQIAFLLSAKKEPTTAGDSQNSILIWAKHTLID